MTKPEMQEEWERRMAGEKPKERYCVDCASMATDGSLMCRRPVIDLVTGKPWTLDLACHTERRPGGGCGENPKFWQPNEAVYEARRKESRESLEKLGAEILNRGFEEDDGA